MTEPQHGLTGKPSNNAGKFKPIKRDSRLNIAVLTADKSAWVRSAQQSGANLTNWVIAALNIASQQ